MPVLDHAEVAHQPISEAGAPRAWPEHLPLSRVPYWVYRDEANHRSEQQRIFEGPCWSFLGLEAEIPNAGDYRTTHLGSMPVIVVRNEEGGINAFENRCAHRGALIAFDDGGNTKKLFRCIYHAWSYDLAGNLKGIAFEHGANGVGGMPAGFCKDGMGPRKLRVARLNGLVFGTLSPDTPSIEDYLGEAVLGRLRRVLNRPIRVMGRFTQALPNNWKLYVENVKDTYHASLLHLFFSTFRITRLTQSGGVLVSPDGGHHASYTVDAPADAQSTAYRDQGIRSENDSYRLRDKSLLDSVDEFGDGIKLQILGMFPGFILQQIHNCLAVRQVLPKAVDQTELNWTYIGFEDDTPEMNRRRLKQQNLVGPAGFVSMEDGCVGGFVQRGIASADEQLSVVEMGGSGAESQATRATEASVRGFWKAYRRCMG